MKINTLIIFMPVLFGLACLSTGPVSEKSALDELYTVRDRIVKGKDTVDSLRDRHVGRTGFFYVMDRGGTVVFHPSPSVIGISFARYDFAREIMEKGEGVLRYDREGLRFRIFYAPLDAGRILCLSIPEEEFGRP